MKKITAEKFEEATGGKPIQDDLDRCNCKHAGEIGHQDCGWDEKRDMPNFMPSEQPVTENGMIHTNDVENIINQLPEKDYYLYYHEDAWWATNEWLCGTFAGRAFKSNTKEGALEELIEYFNNHKRHESIVGRCVDDSGWPNVELVTRYVMKSYEEEPDLK